MRRPDNIAFGVNDPLPPRLALGLALFLLLAVLTKGSIAEVGVGGDFYAIFPHNLLVWLFAPVFLFAVLALGIGSAQAAEHPLQGRIMLTRKDFGGRQQRRLRSRLDRGQHRAQRGAMRH